MDASWPRNRLFDTRYLRPIVATAGSAFAVGIGYMDPGNWATDLDATRYGSTLLWSIVVSGFAAMMLQVLVIRFASASDTGLMEAISARFPAANSALWTVYALAIVATELAEFVGLVIGLQLVFTIGMAASIALAVGILALLLLAGGAAARRFEVLAIITTAGLALVYAYEIGVLRPAAGPIVSGMIVPSFAAPGALLAVVGIVGATIMPHNLFLQAGLVRKTLDDAPPRSRSILVRRATFLTIGTLSIATVINISIAVVGSATHANTIASAFRTLHPVAGPAAASLFGIALIAAALAAAISATCAGDMICTAGAPIKLRRIDRRVLAITPAVALLALGASPTALLVASQVALGLALPAVAIPLIVIVLAPRFLRTLADRILIAVTICVTIATCACDGFALTSLLPHA